jgi:hypothetical protein
MYLQNKYTQWYYNIIKNAQARVNYVGYTEKHHIIPKSLGGTNFKDNLVKLSAKEHYICHLLLTKMVEGQYRSKMVYALWIMNSKNKTQKRKAMSSSIYEKVRKEYAELIRQKRLGRATPQWVKDKISKTLKGVTYDYMKKPKSELWYERHAETHRGKSNNERRINTISSDLSSI